MDVDWFDHFKWFYASLNLFVCLSKFIPMLRRAHLDSSAALWFENTLADSFTLIALVAFAPKNF